MTLVKDKKVVFVILRNWIVSLHSLFLKILWSFGKNLKKKKEMAGRKKNETKQYTFIEWIKFEARDIKDCTEFFLFYFFSFLFLVFCTFSKNASWVLYTRNNKKNENQVSVFHGFMINFYLLCINFCCCRAFCIFILFPCNKLNSYAPKPFTLSVLIKMFLDLTVAGEGSIF